MADGAGISLNEAYLLQLRAELAVGTGKVHSGDGNDECTAFAVLPKAAADVPPQIGQNADLPAFHTEIGVIVEIVPGDDPRVLMPTPAGQSPTSASTTAAWPSSPTT